MAVLTNVQCGHARSDLAVSLRGGRALGIHTWGRGTRRYLVPGQARSSTLLQKRPWRQTRPGEQSDTLARSAATCSTFRPSVLCQDFQPSRRLIYFRVRTLASQLVPSQGMNAGWRRAGVRLTPRSGSSRHRPKYVSRVGLASRVDEDALCATSDYMESVAESP